MSDPLSLRTRRAADARIEALREQFGSFPVQRVTRVVGAEYFERGVDAFEDGSRGTAGARVVDDAGRLLLVRDSRDPGAWVLPAGEHEPGETLVETAEREVWEEAGLDCAVTGIWRAVRKRFVRRDEPQRRGYLLELFFTAEYVAGTAAVRPERWDDGEEILDVRWFESIPESALPVVEDPTAPPVV